VSRLRSGPTVRPDPDPWGLGTPPEVRRFLQGPQPRRHELIRAIRIFVEFVRGFRALHFVGPCVTVFGSARFKEDHAYYGARAKPRWYLGERWRGMLGAPH
jgi:hypothetical protein